MSLKSWKLGLALAAGAALPSQSATFYIALDAKANGTGNDFFGSFVADDETGVVSNFALTIVSETFDTNVASGFYSERMTARYNTATNDFFTLFNTQVFFTQDAPGANPQTSLTMGNVSVRKARLQTINFPKSWGFTSCTLEPSGPICQDLGTEAGIQGTYTIQSTAFAPTPAAVPLPAALPMLAAAMAAFGLMRRRKA